MRTNVLEVESQGVYYLDGMLWRRFGGFDFLHRIPPTSGMSLKIMWMGGRERIKVKTYKEGLCLGLI